MAATAISSPQARSPRWLSALAAALTGRPNAGGPASAAHRGARAVWRPF